MTDATVQCEQITKRFGKLTVLQDVSFNVAPGHILALLGPSGCGKTTTLRLIAGFEQLDQGRIAIAGQVVADNGFHLPPEKRRVGMVFQDYAIFPHLTVGQNIAFGLGRGRESVGRTAEMLHFVGLAGQEEKMPHQLSGGQQQRVALARALAPEPAVLLLDEPFSNLDTNLRVQVRQEVRRLLKESRTTAIFVTHDQEEALYLGDRIGVMNEGQLLQIGTPDQIFHRPQTRFVAEFMGHTDFVPGEVTGEGVVTAMGTLPQQPHLPPATVVSVAVRPDDVQLQPDDAGNGRVIDCQFLGIAHLVAVALADETIIHSWQPHTARFAIGSAVQATIRRDHPVTVFHGERAIG